MSQQIFTDLNRYTLKPAQSLSILYDTRDPYAEIARIVAKRVSFFKDFIEFEKTTISNRSIELFTLNGIYNATKLLLGKIDDAEAYIDYACTFWESLGKNLNEWREHAKGKISSSMLRQNYLSGHNIFINAVAITTNAADKIGFRLKDVISVISKENWKRDNPLWEGRALQNGRITKSNISLLLTVNVLKSRLEIALNEKEAEAEASLQLR